MQIHYLARVHKLNFYFFSSVQRELYVVKYNLEVLYRSVWNEWVIWILNDSPLEWLFIYSIFNDCDIHIRRTYRSRWVYVYWLWELEVDKVFCSYCKNFKWRRDDIHTRLTGSRASPSILKSTSTTASITVNQITVITLENKEEPVSTDLLALKFCICEEASNVIATSAIMRCTVVHIAWIAWYTVSSVWSNTSFAALIAI